MRTVYLLAGLLCDEAVWAHQAQALRDRFDVRVRAFQAFDSIAAMAEHVLADAPASFAVAGHSMGGRVALEVLRRAPVRVDRLALLDSGYEPAAAGEAERRALLVGKAQREGIAAIAEAWARPMIAPCNQDDRRLIEEIVAMVGRMSPDIYVRQTRALLCRPDAAALLPAIRCPTLVLCGREDAWSPPERHRRMAETISGSRLRLIDDCGHMSLMERPAAVLSALEDWLAVS
jgi:pimeloyl-ACP methyl ester carboxylesterase